MSSFPGFIYSQLFASLPYPATDLTGQTVCVTGSNTGLGLEAARHFTRCNAERVILAVRSIERGEAAKRSIEASTGKTSVEVWQLDLASYESVKEFAARVDRDLPRLDVMVENAGIQTETYRELEGHESTITVNVISPFLLALLLLPKLRQTATRFNVLPHLVIVSSEVQFSASFPERHAPEIFKQLSDKESANMGDRYNTSKLLETFLVRELARRMEQSGKGEVIVNAVNPGFCHSELSRDFHGIRSILVMLFKAVLARSTEYGSRTLVSAATAGKETNGQYLSDCCPSSPAPIVLGEEGEKTQLRVWNELMQILEDVQPGPKVVHQVPDGSIVPTASSTPQAPLIDFDRVSPYVIPRQGFCDRLVSVCDQRYRVLGHPVCIHSRKYDRNEFIFNLSIVLEADEDMSSYVTVVRRLATLFRSLEEQSEFLSREEEVAASAAEAGDDATSGSGSGKGKVYALCEIILEDLNNYCECMIPIDDSDTINIKLFPLYAPPPPVKAWHVPLSTVRLESLMDENWDLTMQRIVPFINGINSVGRIAELADADFDLVTKCIEHLLYYACLLMLDVFQFGAMYAPTAEMATFIEDRAMQQECSLYISTVEPRLAPSALIALYTSLRPGQSLKSWCIEHKKAVTGLDIRRFITFGVIKGLLYRIHKYIIKPRVALNGPPTATATTHARMLGVVSGGSGGGGGAGGGGGGVAKRAGLAVVRSAENLALVKFLDGRHCFDEICTELHVGEKEVLAHLRTYGEVQIIHK
ncbi:MAG: Nitrogen permease regulator 2 [Phylliscum demangeonii]|nr:MAG: Nitrogen permease regulator 2 [Phylliscum demangeonii]